MNELAENLVTQLDDRLYDISESLRPTPLGAISIAGLLANHLGCTLDGVSRSGWCKKVNRVKVGYLPWEIEELVVELDYGSAPHSSTRVILTAVVEDPLGAAQLVKNLSLARQS